MRDFFLIFSFSLALAHSLAVDNLEISLIGIGVSSFIDAVFVIYSIFSIRSVSIQTLLLSILLITFGLLTITLSSTVDVPLYESLRAVKWLFYLVVLLNLRNGLHVSDRFYIIFSKISFGLIFVKYLWDKLSLGLLARPSLVYENNFETLFLTILFIGVIAISNQNPDINIKIWLGFLLIIGFLSLSRWTILSTFGLTLFIFRHSLTIRSWKIRLPILVSAIISLILTLGLRSQPIQDIDRVKFLKVLVKEIDAESLLVWLMRPHLVLRAMSLDSCMALKFYQDLFAGEGSNSCYSVILHSFILRILFDFGPIILIIYFAIFYKLIRPILGRELAVVSVVIVFLNGLSVSSMNTGFGTLPFALIILNRSSLRGR